MNSQVKQLDFTGQKVFVGMDVHTCVPKHFGAPGTRRAGK